ncbi:hypothetical protein LCGC14_1811890 [marine sediment metagenome]|uniref:Uncharacterized protein n=1 Tax=marine sediment metagenome TaxID=412755 RepID=A0A0F9H9L7_9ZZZZ
MEATRGYIMGGTTYGMLVFYASVLVKGGHHYCHPGIEAIKKRLAQFQNINCENSWLYAVIQKLEGQGLIKRRKRVFRKKDGTIRSDKSLISITIKGYNLLISKGFTAAIALRDALIAYINGDDKRFPNPSDEFDPKRSNVISKGLDKIGDVFKNIVYLVI